MLENGVKESSMKLSTFLKLKGDGHHHQSRSCKHTKQDKIHSLNHFIHFTNYCTFLIQECIEYTKRTPSGV